MSSPSVGVQLGVVVPLLVLMSLSCFLWWKLFPRLQQYRDRHRTLDKINKRYEELRSSRSDFVYHYYWSKERGDIEESVSFLYFSFFHLKIYRSPTRSMFWILMIS